MNDFEFLKTNNELYLNRSLKHIEGQIPKDLNGTLYRVGAHQFEAFGKTHNHWFDGDGGLVKIHFSRGDITASVAHLDLHNEQEAAKGDFLIGRFGRAPKGIWRRIKAIWDYRQYQNSANTALMLYKKKLFALYEAGMAVEVDKNTLETKREESFDVAIRSFSAHPKYIAKKKITYNFGFRVLPTPSLDIFALPENGHPEKLGSLGYNGSTFLHDFGISENYAIFVISPVFISAIDMIFKGQSVADGMTFKTSKRTIVKGVRLDDFSKQFEIPIAPLLYTHTINCFESNNSIILDGITYADGTNLDWINSVKRGNSYQKSSDGRVTRFTIDPHKESVDVTHKCQDMEVPTIQQDRVGDEHRFIYGAAYHSQTTDGKGLYKALKRIDRSKNEVKTLFVDDDQVMSEPIYVPKDEKKQETGDGYVLSLNHDLKSQKSYCAISCFQDKPQVLAKIWFDHHIPFTFHGLWEPDSSR